MEKLYLAYSGEVSEVNITKETPKQFKLSVNNANRALINKKDLDSPLEPSYFAPHGTVVFSKDRETAKAIYNSIMKKNADLMERYYDEFTCNRIVD